MTRRERKKESTFSMCRIYYVIPKDRERFCLRALLLHFKGATCFKSLRSVDGICLENFSETALALHLLEDDIQWHVCLIEASLFKFGPELRHVFALILVNCSLSELLKLRDDIKRPLLEDLFFKAKREHAGQIVSTATMAAKAQLMEEAEVDALCAFDDNLRALDSSLKDFTTLPRETSHSIIGEPKAQYDEQILEELAECTMEHVDQWNESLIPLTSSALLNTHQ